MKIPREYQKNIFDSIIKNGNTLVVLPTGMGKTLIALMLIDYELKEIKKMRKEIKNKTINEGIENTSSDSNPICVFVSPTKPLVKQHVETIKKELNVDAFEVSGSINKQKRKEIYNKANVIVATPQTIQNDIKTGILNPNNIILLIVDEAHRTVGKYAYTYICEKSKHALIVGLTASPGGKSSRINEVMKNLNIQNIEIRKKTDIDVKPYTHQTKIRWIKLNLTPTYILISNLLKNMLNDHIIKLKKMIGVNAPVAHKAQFIKLREKILQIKSNIKYPAIVEYTIILHLNHMIELTETQSIYALLEYIKNIKSKTSKSAKMIFKDERMKKIEQYTESEELHPKTKKLLEIVKNEIKEGRKGIIFVQYRDQIFHIVDLLKKEGFKVKPFIGKRKGVTKKDQEQTMEEFRSGNLDMLIASSIGEEGLDIPSVDVVIFYEPIPSEIRSIQRRGRTGRFENGNVIILITNDTRDAYYYWASVKKEKQMYKILERMKNRNKIRVLSDKNETKSKIDKGKNDMQQNVKTEKDKVKKKDKKKIVQSKILDFK